MIVKTITDDYYFWNWLKHSDSYSSSFTLEGAKALQAHLDEYSEDTETGSIEFDPVAWCVEFTEYANIAELNEQMGEIYTLTNGEGTDLTDVTTVIDIDGTRFIVQDF